MPTAVARFLVVLQLCAFCTGKPRVGKEAFGALFVGILDALAIEPTAYTVYFVAKNIWGDSQARVSSLPFTTATSGVLPSGYVYQGGLVWMPVRSHDTWAKAKAYCAAFNGLGLSGWRQPSSGEAVSLIASGAANGQGWVWGYLWTYEQDYLGNPVAVDPSGLVVWIEGGGDDGYIDIACVR